MDKLEKALVRMASMLHLFLMLKELENPEAETEKPLWNVDVSWFETIRKNLESLLVEWLNREEVIIDLKNMQGAKQKASETFMSNIVGEGHYATIMKISHLSQIILLTLGSGDKKALFGLIYNMYEWLGIVFNDKIPISLEDYESSFGPYQGKDVIKQNGTSQVPISAVLYYGDLIIDEENITRLLNFGNQLIEPQSGKNDVISKGKTDTSPVGLFRK